MLNVDADHNGYLDYNEFIISAIDKKAFFSKQSL